MTERIEVPVTAGDRRRMSDHQPEYIPHESEKRTLRQLVNRMLIQSGLLDTWEVIELGRGSIDCDGEQCELTVKFIIKDREV